MPAYRGAREAPLADLSIRKVEPPRRTTWRTSDLLRAAVVFAGVYVGLQLLWFASNILFVAFLGILFGVALSAAVDRLSARGIPRVAGTAGIMLTLLGVVVLAGVLMAPTVREQTQELRIQLPQALDRLENWIDERDGFFSVLLSAGDDAPEEEGAREEPEEAPEDEPEPDPDPGAERPQESVEQDEGEGPPSETVRRRLTEQLGDLGAHLFAFLTSTAEVLGGILLILFMAIYIAINPGTYRRGILFLIPSRGRDKAAEVLSEASYMLRRWLVTQLIAMVLVGATSALALMLLDVRAALALGILAGLLEFIPIFGPIIAAVPAIAMGFLESPTVALYVLIAYVVIQQIESQLLVPILMKEGIDMPPVLTVLAQALMALLFGFIGLLVAVPLVAVVIVFVKMLYVQDVVGEDVLLPREAHD
jgi:predicted PurR-regulated permease PerM